LLRGVDFVCQWICSGGAILFQNLHTLEALAPGGCIFCVSASSTGGNRIMTSRVCIIYIYIYIYVASQAHHQHNVDDSFKQSSQSHLILEMSSQYVPCQISFYSS